MAKNKRLAIIDFDTAVYKVALRGMDNTFDKDEDFEEEEVTEEEYEKLFVVLEDTLMNILYDTNCTSYRAYLTGKENFRYKFLPSYKWRRSSKPAPKALLNLKKMCLARLTDCYLRAGEEADDSCCRDYTTEEEGITKVLCHIDKDLNQVAGEHFDMSDNSTYSISKKDADDWVWYQVLAGDTADCYKGCPFVGGELTKGSIKSSGMSKAERIAGSKAMDIVKGTLTVKPVLHEYTKGKLAGTKEIKWEEYHSTLPIEQRVLSWFIKGYVMYGGIGHKLGFNTTSGYEDNVKVPMGYNLKLTKKDLAFIIKEIQIQYTIAYMLKSGESIPKKLHAINF